MNYYEVLGADKNSDAATIKRLYRALASVHHPDKGGKTEDMQRIQKAYDVLSDPERRKVYDETGTDAQHNDEGEMNGIIYALFVQILDGAAIDPIQEMRNHFLSEIARAEHRVGVVLTGIEARKRAIKKTKRRKGENVLAGMLAQDIRRKELELKAIAGAVDKLRRMIAMVDEYEFEMDVAPGFHPGAFPFPFVLLR